MAGININDIPEHLRGGVHALIAAQDASSQMSTDQFPSAPQGDKPLNSPFRSSGKFAKNGAMVGGAGEDGPSPFAHNPRAVVPYSGGAVAKHSSFNENGGAKPAENDFRRAPWQTQGSMTGEGTSSSSEGVFRENHRQSRNSNLPVPYEGAGGGSHNPPPTERNATSGSNGGGGWVNQHYTGSGGVRNALQKGTDAFQRSRVFAGPNGVTQAIRYTIGAPPMTQRTRRMYQASAYENLNDDQFPGSGDREV